MKELAEKLLKEYLGAQRGNEVVFTVSKLLYWARQRRKMWIPPSVKKFSLAVIIREEFQQVVDNQGRTWILKKSQWRRRWNNGHRRFTYTRIE